MLPQKASSNCQDDTSKKTGIKELRMSDALFGFGLWA